MCAFWKGDFSVTNICLCFILSSMLCLKALKAILVWSEQSNDYDWLLNGRTLIIVVTKVEFMYEFHSRAAAYLLSLHQSTIQLWSTEKMFLCWTSEGAVISKGNTCIHQVNQCFLKGFLYRHIYAAQVKALKQLIQKWIRSGDA